VHDLDIIPCNEILQAIHKKNPQYSTIVVAGNDGIINCCAIPLKKPINVNDRTWFNRIKANPEFVIDHFVISRSAHKAILPFAYPVVGPDGSLKAAVGAGYNLKQYNSLFDKIALPEGSNITLTDRNGLILYQSSCTGKCLGEPFAKNTGVALPKQESPKGKFEAIDAGGVSRIYWYEWLWAGQQSNKICILIGISQDTLLEGIIRTLTINLGTLAVIAILSFAIAWYLGERIILNPILNLVNKTKQIKDGKWAGAKHESRLPQELCILDEAIDEMAGDLSQREQERDKALQEAHNELEEHRKTEAELRDREEHLNILFKQAADSIYVSDISGKLKKVNTEACRATGYSESELLQLNIADIDVFFKTRNDSFGSLEALPHGKPTSFTSVHRRKDGSTFPVEITISRFDTPVGNLVMGLVRDITERNRLEAQLHQAQKLDAIGQLAGGIAHDFNNMLGGIMGAAEILSLHIADDSEAKQYQTLILKTVSRAADLTGALLAFSKSSPKASSKLDIHEIINDAVALLKNTIDRRIEIKLEFAAPNSLVVGDPSQLQNVFLNMGINSSHAMPQGGAICFSTQVVELDKPYCDASPFDLKPGNFIKIEVRDTGEGIPQDQIHKIFEPFFTNKKKGKGTGLGLSAAYGTIKQHQGSITVYSEEGVGTSFHIMLPLSGGQGMPQVKVQEVHKGNGRILVADDEEILRTTARVILEELGYEVVLVCNGQEALEVYRKEEGRFDLVILDMVMPVMNGKDCFMALKKIDPEVRVIISSGFAQEEDLKQLKQEGLLYFVRKPHQTAALSQVIHKALGADQP
jgi:PAS domain S-box-containing protein